MENDKQQITDFNGPILRDKNTPPEKTTSDNFVCVGKDRLEQMGVTGIYVHNAGRRSYFPANRINTVIINQPEDVLIIIINQSPCSYRYSRLDSIGYARQPEKQYLQEIGEVLDDSFKKHGEL